MVADHQGRRHQSGIAHDPKKWEPVFGKDHAQIKSWRGSRLLLLIGVVLFVSLVLLRLVVPDRATGGCANKAVVTGDMAGDTTDRRALEASLRVGRSAHQSDCKRQSGAAEKSLHRQNSIVAILIRGDGIRSRLAMMAIEAMVQQQNLCVLSIASKINEHNTVLVSVADTGSGIETR
jgi:hypothetical protein